jgi:hypothetical protein
MGSSDPDFYEGVSATLRLFVGAHREAGAEPVAEAAIRRFGANPGSVSTSSMTTRSPSRRARPRRRWPVHVAEVVEEALPKAGLGNDLQGLALGLVEQSVAEVSTLELDDGAEDVVQDGLERHAREESHADAQNSLSSSPALK